VPPMTAPWFFSRSAHEAGSEVPSDRHRMSKGLLVTTSTFPVAPDDGSPRFVLDLAEALAEHLAVTVLAPDAPGAQRCETWGPVEIVRFTYFWPRRLQCLAYGGGMRDNLRGSFLARLQVLSFLWRQAAAVRKLVAQRRIDFVNSHWMVPQGLTAALARGRRGRFRHVLHVHAADVYFLARVPLGRAVARFVMARTDASFADGSHVRDALDQLLGRPSDATLQPNGVNTELFRPREGVKVIDSPFPDGHLVFVGRFVEKKGVVYLLRALSRVREREPGVGLVLIGYGPLEDELRQEAATLGLHESVLFVGKKTHQEVVGYLHGCRAAIVPSIIDSHGETEGMPTVVVEAMAAGARVVASAVDGIPDVVCHGENGWLCREKDPEDLAEKILIALSDSSPSHVVQAALSTGEQNDWREVARNYCSCFRQLGGDQTPSGAGGGNRSR
jgi:glycosyltransferase involved in cell wall biosynthesis